MKEMKVFLTTFYFDNITLKKRQYITLEVCIIIIENSLFCENQHDGRIRFWGVYQNRFLRVITLADGLTIHNAFFDRNFDLIKRGLG